MVPKLWQLGLSLQGKISNSKSIPIEVDFIAGTCGFIAPECYGTTITDKSDVYSFGMALLSLACTNNNLTIIDKIIMVHNEEVVNMINIIDDNFWKKFLEAEFIDPILMRLIGLPCLEVYMDIVKRCLKFDPNERPAMGEVEVELEHALAVQEEEEKFWKE